MADNFTKYTVEEEYFLTDKNIENDGISDKINNVLDDLDESTLRNYLDTITNTFKGRVTGTKTCHDMGQWIFNELNKLSALDVRKHYWISRGNVYHKFRRYSGKNIIADIQGTSEDTRVIVFSAHYDVGSRNSPGALDNGAGVAALLTIAQVLSSYEFETTIRFIAFSGEEQGLLGSYAYAKQVYEDNEHIIGVINADVIGNNTNANLGNYHSLRCFSTYPMNWIIEVMNQTCTNYNINLIVNHFTYYGNSDDKSFDDYGFPAMQLFQSGNGMESYYGTEHDKISLINMSYLFEVTKCIAASLAVLLDMKHTSIEITKPLENNIYGDLFDLIPLSKGKTFFIGTPHVTTVVINESVQIKNVTFSLLKGKNEVRREEDEQVKIASYIDYQPPFEWFVEESCFGWYTIRAEVYDELNNSYADEMEVFIIR
ncbi:MAG: M28 family peptidase [Candidatus Thermoplasmatota archaeon]|nr:M28 family peptidase [Candidatus Thermoplasmatota archaeon]